MGDWRVTMPKEKPEKFKCDFIWSFRDNAGNRVEKQAVIDIELANEISGLINNSIKEANVKNQLKQ